MNTPTITHEGNQYIISKDKPQNGDLVITDNYGVWTFQQAPCPLPYWGNPNACKKLIEFNPK